MTARDRQWFAVAERAGGGRTVAELRRAMTVREFRGWCEYVAREPSVGARLDWWCGQLLAAVLSLFRRTPVKAAELIPDRWGDRPAPASARLRGKDLADALKALFGGGGG